MAKIVERGIVKPTAGIKGGRKEVVVSHGIRTVGSSAFDRRPDGGVDPVYVGPSKVMSRGSGISAGSGQKKKHKSAGRGQR